MIFPDYHLHSSFSTDSNADIRDIIKSAQEKGLTSICITDHYDMDFPTDPDEPDMTFYLDTDKYYEYMRGIRSEVKSFFDLRIGVELGIMPETISKLHDYVISHKELDFVIASTHLVDGYDPYRPEYFVGKSEYESYSRYFESILENIKIFKDFNVYGHLDYIMRYGKDKAQNFNISDYYDIFKEIFKILVHNGKGIEINTGSLYRGLDFPHPHIDILKIYKETGGEIITVGSDAHKPEHIGYGFEIAKDILKSLDFKYYCTFKNQNASYIDIA